MVFINLGSQTFSPFAFMVFAYGLVFFFFIYCVWEARLFGMHQSHNLELNCFPPADVFISWSVDMLCDIILGMGLGWKEGEPN